MNTCAERFIANLKEKDLNYQTRERDNDEVVVSFPYKGKVTECFFTGEDGKYLSMYLVIERVPEEKFAEAILQCNTLNTRYKWVTYYVDNDKDLIAHNDAILSVENAAEEAFELLIRLLQITEDVKPEIMRTLYA